MANAVRGTYPVALQRCKQIALIRERLSISIRWKRLPTEFLDIAMTEYGGDFPGDDEAIVRGLKYVVTGNCNSSAINVANLGIYDMPESLLEFYRNEIRKIFQSGNYIIGSAVLYSRGVCHSFVLMGMVDDKSQVYGSWDRGIETRNVYDVFGRGFFSALGVGMGKWIQYITNED